MLTNLLTEEENKIQFETLDSYILKEHDYSISHNAKFVSFKHRSKVEFLKFFIV